MRNRARPKSNRNHRTHPASFHKPNERQLTDMIDQLAEFEDFRATILPALRKDLARGLTAAELREKYSSLVQARQIAEAVTAEDPSKAHAAGKDVLDRAEGKAVERKEVKHQFENLSDQELDAILQSEEQEVKEMEDRFEQ